MSKVVRVTDGNYKIVVPEGNSIVLDAGASGSVVATGPLTASEITVPEGQTTYNLLDTGVTTVNFAGDATAINIGADTGTTSIKNDLEVIGNLTIRGSSSEINSTTLTVDDINIILGDTETPTNITADGGGITLKGTTDKTFNWVNLTSSWTSSENLDIANTKTFKINGTDVLSTSGVLTSSTSVNAFTSATTLNVGANTGTTNIKNNLDVDGDVNIDGGDLTVSTSTFNLATSNATTVNAFTAATVLNIGDVSGTTNIKNNLDVDGDVNIDGGDLTVSTSTFNLANTTATTVNAFGAATTLNVGATSGTTNVKNNLDVDGDVNIDGGDLTASTSTFNIANQTVTTANMLGEATAINLGSSTGTTTVNHNLAVNGVSLSTNKTTFDLLDANATTINFGGDADSIVVGKLGGTVIIKGDLTVEGTRNEAQTYVVENKTIELGNPETPATPSDTTADGGGIILKGTTDKTILWYNGTDRWTFNQDIESTGIQNTPIGNSSAASGAFTSLTASSPSVVSVNSGSTAFRITQAGSGDAFVVEDEANPDSTPFAISSSGNVGIGVTPNGSYKLDVTGNVRITGTVTGTSYTSTVSTGTAPLTVSSTTKVANLNADLLDDMNTSTSATVSSIAARDASGDLTANKFISTVSTGTAPLTVSSTTKVANLNADLLDDMNTSSTTSASTIVSRDSDGDIEARQFTSTIAIGTAPLVVTSTTKVANLNADLLDDMNTSSSNVVSTVVARDSNGDFAGRNITATAFYGSGANLTSIPQSAVTNLTTDLSAKAPLSNPTFTGTVTATAFSGSGANLTSIPQSAITNLTTDLSAKASLSGATFTGVVLVPQDLVSIISGNTSAVAGYTYVLNAAGITLTLPGITDPTAQRGTKITVINRSGATDCIVARNGSNISGLAADLAVSYINASFTLEYIDTTTGWAIYNSIPASSNTANAIVARDSNGDFAGRNITATAFYGSGANLTSIPQSAVTNLTTDLSAKASLAGATFTGKVTFASATTLGAKLLNAAEQVTINASAITSPLNYDLITQSIVYYTTNTTSNWTTNFRGNSTTTLNSILSTGESVTVVLMAAIGASGYNNTIQVDGTASGVTVKYQGGTAWSAGFANALNVYTYTIIKTGDAAFTILASLSKF